MFFEHGSVKSPIFSRFSGGDVGAFLGNRTVATIFTWVVLLIFCALVFTGWYYLFVPILESRPGAVIVAALITLLAVICARQVGQYRAAARERGERPAWHHGWKFYIFLAIISALGTLNAAFIMFESRAILRTDISEVRSRYGALRDAGQVQLTPVGYNEKQARVAALLENLHEEIVNPNRGAYCGVGPAARSIIADLRAEIPGFRELNGSGAIQPCDVAQAERVYQSYAQMAQRMVRGDIGLIGASGPVRLNFLDELRANYDEMDRGLETVEAAAIGIGGVDSIDIQPLYRARDDYNADRQTFASLGGQTTADTPEITSLQIDEVNSYASTLNLFRKRLLHIATWVYLLIAIGLDLALIGLLTELNVRFGSAARAKAVVVDPRFYTDPRFLWSQRSIKRN